MEYLCIHVNIASLYTECSRYLLNVRDRFPLRFINKNKKKKHRFIKTLEKKL